MLRTVKGGSAADLDSRALTTDDDLIDLDELYPSSDDPSRSDRRNSGDRALTRFSTVGRRPSNARTGRRRHTRRRAGPRNAKRSTVPALITHAARHSSPLPSPKRRAPPRNPRATGQPLRRGFCRAGRPARPHAEVAERPSLTRTFGRMLPAPGRALGAAVLALVVAGVAATVITELLPGSPPGHPQPKRASSVGHAPRLGPSTSQIDVSDAQSLVAQKRAMSLTVERLASEQQAAEQRQARARATRRQARARAAARRRARIKAQHALAASTASSTTSSAAPLVSSAADSTVSQSSGASSAASLPSTTSPAPSSSSSSSHSTNQSPAGSKQPAFGSAGSLGPGSSPDG